MMRKKQIEKLTEATKALDTTKIMATTKIIAQRNAWKSLSSFSSSSSFLLLMFIYLASVQIFLCECLIIKKSGLDRLDINEFIIKKKVNRNPEDDYSVHSSRKDLSNQLLTNNPCLVHYCPKGRECVVDDNINQPICICQRFCSHRKRSICGSDGKLYENHCELHRASCLYDRQITYQSLEKCLGNVHKKYSTKKFLQVNDSNNNNNNNEDNDGMEYRTNETLAKVITATIATAPASSATVTKTTKILTITTPTITSSTTAAMISTPKTPKIETPIISLIDNENKSFNKIMQKPSSSLLSTTFNEQTFRSESTEENDVEIEVDNAAAAFAAAAIKRTNKKEFCSSQEYEIMKDNLLLYNHARLMTQDNNHSKDFLVSIMFSHYDQNNNAHLELEELNQISTIEHIDELSNGCVLDDMLSFDDIDHDGRLSINEFYQAFSKLYSVSVVSLDKALETNHLSARVGDNVEIKCDVTGSPSPPIIWRRNGVDLSSINGDEIRVFSDGSLYLTRIQLFHSGNYTCHAQRNKDVVQTHILNVYTIPEVRVMPRLQSRRPSESSEMWCHITGDPFPKVEWLKNNENINLSVSGKYEILGNGTALKIHNIEYSDTGAYMCQATNIGGTVREITSLIVQEEPTPTVMNEERKFFVFHEYGIAVYEPAACRLYHQIQSTDIILGTQDYVCGGKGVKCIWGRVLNVGTRYIYASQPTRDQIIVISTIQMVVIDVIATDKYPVELHYVGHLDQIWILNWRFPENIDSKTIQVIRDAGQKRKHYAIHPQPIDGQFDLVKDLFIPSRDLEQPHYSYKYGYVTHKNQRGLYKIDLTSLHYTKSVDLTLYNCVPESIEFSALYGFVIIFCREPITNRSQGQLLLDYLTDTVISTKPMLNGIPHISPDSRHLATIDRNANGGAVIIIQKITPNGLEFLFDVKTSLNISDITFYESQAMHGYDLFATADEKEDILYLNLYTGKVEMITGVGESIPLDLVKWGNVARMIRSSGLFGLYMVTPANNALFVINGKARTVNCEIGGIIHPIAIVWISTFNNNNNNNSNNYINIGGSYTSNNIRTESN